MSIQEQKGPDTGIKAEAPLTRDDGDKRTKQSEPTPFAYEEQIPKTQRSEPDGAERLVSGDVEKRSVSPVESVIADPGSQASVVSKAGKEAQSKSKGPGLPEAGSDAIREVPFEPYSPPTDPVLLLDEKETGNWTKALKRSRLLVICSLDEDVLYAAEASICGAVDFSTRDIRMVLLPRTPSPAPLKFASKDPTGHDKDKKDSERKQSTLESLCDEASVKPLFLVAEAYGSRETTSLLESLPNERGYLEGIKNKLATADSYILILTKPHLLKTVRHGSGVRIVEIADFLLPRLKDANVVEMLIQQYKAGLWTSEHPSDYRQDEDFYNAIMEILNPPTGMNAGDHEGRALLIRFAKAVNEAHKSDRFKDDATGLKAEFERLHEETFKAYLGRRPDWPEAEDYLSSVLLFVGAFFDGLPLAVFERIVTQLLAGDKTRHPLATRILSRNDQATTVQVYREVPWSQIWNESRNAALNRCSPLRVRGKQGAAVVACRTTREAEQLRGFFATHYPFTCAEMWRRMLGLGLLFDGDRDLVDQVILRIAERAAMDPDRFGQTFLSQVLDSDQALALLQGDVEDRFRQLQEEGRLPFVLARLASLFEGMLSMFSNLSNSGNTEKRFDLISAALEQFIDWRVPEVALFFLRRLSGNVHFGLVRRMAIAEKIFNTSGKEYWRETRSVIQRWASNPFEGAEVIQKIGKWLPSADAIKPRQVIPSAGVLVGLARAWMAGPKNIKRHEITGLLDAQGSDGVMNTLVRWLFHPALEGFVEDGEEAWFFSYWLLSETARRTTGDGREFLEKFQLELILEYDHRASMQLNASVGSVDLAPALKAREFQATVIADWAGAFLDDATESAKKRLEELFDNLRFQVPEKVRKQIHAVWRTMDQAVTPSLVMVAESCPSIALARTLREKMSDARRIWKAATELWSSERKPSGGE